VKYSFAGSGPGYRSDLDSESRPIFYEDVNVILFDASHAVPDKVAAMVALTRGVSRSPSRRGGNKKFSLRFNGFYRRQHAFAFRIINRRQGKHCDGRAFKAAAATSGDDGSQT
jgi:hypothetical protein